MFGLFADGELRTRMQDEFRKTGRGPERGVTEFAKFISGERKAGRLPPGADPKALGTALMGAALNRAMLDAVGGVPASAVGHRALVQSLIEQMFPDE